MHPSERRSAVIVTGDPAMALEFCKIMRRSGLAPAEVNVVSARMLGLTEGAERPYDPDRAHPWERGQ